MEQNNNENRKHLRKRISGRVIYKYADLLDPQAPPDEMRKSFEARSADISISGMQLIVDIKLSIGAVIKMDIFIPGEKVPITTFGQVEWCRKHEEIIDVFYAGINFLVVDADHTQQIRMLVGE